VTELIRTDGIVAAAAATITADKLTDVDKVRAIYDWVVAHDVGLPGSRGAKLPFLMYPPAETRVDSLDPDPFKYTITAREVAA